MKTALAALAAATLFAAAFTGLGALAAEEPSEDRIRWRGGFDCEAAYQPRDIVFHESSSYIARKPVGECVAPPDPLWGLVVAGGERGSSGSFSGKFESPDGNFRINVTNAGIALVGPGASVTLDAAKVTVEGGASVSVKGGVTVDVDGSAMVKVGGPLVQLRGGCSPVARLSDSVLYYVEPPGIPMWGPILAGSPKVLVC